MTPVSASAEWWEPAAVPESRNSLQRGKLFLLASMRGTILAMKILRWARVHKKLAVVSVAILAIGLFVVRSRNGNGTVEEATVGRGTVEEELVLTGEIKATDYASLQFNTSGTVAWVGVKVGEKVTKGQVLLKLDTIKLNAAYQVARANYRAAEANAQEVLDDVKGNDSDETFAQKNDRTAAETARDKGWDALMAAQKDLQDATLVAPFDGVVAIVNSESPGVNITAATPQVVVVNPETLYFEVLADQTEVAFFEPGDTAEIVLDAFETGTLNATVTSVSIAPDSTETGTVYPIRLALAAPETLKYKIGMTGDASFILSRKDDVLYVPSGFVNSDSEGDYVLINSGKDKKYIEMGIEGEDRVEIKGDISEGEKVFD